MDSAESTEGTTLVSRESGPLVSVVIPTRNRSSMLSRAIAGVLQQTYANIEVIVVDDASDDNTPDVAGAFDDPRVRYYRHRARRYTSAARNTGIRHSRGEYIAFLDDDDEWLPAKLSRQMPLMMQAPPEVALVYCWMDHFDAQGRLVYETHPTLRGNVFAQVLDRPRLGGCPTLLVRRGVIEEVGGFDEELPRGNDGDFVRRICLKYSVDVVPEVLVRVNVGHQHERITRFDEEGIRNAIKGHSAKLTKFRGLLPKYPKQTASIYSSIGYHHSQLREWRNGTAFYWKAVKTAPLYARVYLSALRSLRDGLLNPRRP